MMKKVSVLAKTYYTMSVKEQINLYVIKIFHKIQIAQLEFRCLMSKLLFLHLAFKKITSILKEGDLSVNQINLKDVFKKSMKLEMEDSEECILDHLQEF